MTGRNTVQLHGANHASVDPIPGVVTTYLLETFNASGTLSTFTGVAPWYPQSAGAVERVHVGLGVAPTGGSIAVKVNLNGSNFGTLTIASGTLTGSFVPAAPAFARDDRFTVDQTSGSTTLGAKALVLQLWGHYT